MSKKRTARRQSTKVGRNDPCPCGSGKKFKQCHWTLRTELPGASETSVSNDSGYRHCNVLSAEARELYESGKPKEAFDKAEAVFQRGHMCPAWEDACHLMVSVFLEEQHIRAAEPLAHLVASYDKKCPLGHFQLGLVLEAQGKALSAAQAFLESIRASEAIHGTLPPAFAHVHLARNAAEAERLDLFDPFIERWAKTPPQDDDERYSYAICLFEVGRSADAEQLLKALLERTPLGAQQASLYHGLAICAMQRGDLDSARTGFAKALDIGTSADHASRMMLAMVEARAGRTGEAVRHARRAVAEAPANLGYRINLASCLSMNRDYAEAIIEYELILDEVPEHHETRFSFAIAFLESGQIDRGLEQLKTLERSGWQPEVTAVNIGVALARRQYEGDLEESLARHRRALSNTSWIGPKRAILVLNTVSILSQLGDFAHIEEFAKEDITGWPSWATAELSGRIVDAKAEQRTQLISEVVRVFGEDALAAMLTASVRAPTSSQGTPEHRGSVSAVPTETLKKEASRAAHAIAASARPRETESEGTVAHRERMLKDSARIGIITALPKEFAAMKAMLEDPIEIAVAGSGAGRRYVLGEIPARAGGSHAVVLTMAEMGNNIASARATLLLEHFPAVEALVMAGIAGGAPNPSKPAEHVRLGDIVVSDQKGVVQYDFDKETPAETIHRHPPRPPSARLLEAVRHLQAAEYEGDRPWIKFISLGDRLKGTRRPGEDEDKLADLNDPLKFLAHPPDPERTPGEPRVFVGPIASANKLLKNPHKRDQLRDLFGVRAIEMEASGVADATWSHDRGYLVVRGVCDYCDSLKGDRWQLYAAVIAAAYTRALLESMPSASTTAT